MKPEDITMSYLDDVDGISQKKWVGKREENCLGNEK